MDEIRHAEVGTAYEVVAGGDVGVGYSVRGVLRSKNKMMDGERFWHFEGGAFECLVRPQDIRELNKIRRVMLW